MNKMSGIFIPHSSDQRDQTSLFCKLRVCRVNNCPSARRWFISTFSATFKIFWIFWGQIWMMIHFNLFRYFSDFLKYFEDKYEWWFISIYSATSSIFSNIFFKIWIMILFGTFGYFLDYFKNVLMQQYKWRFNYDDDTKKLITTQPDNQN